MLRCWNSDPEDRPSFTIIGSNISKDLQTMEGYLDMSSADTVKVQAINDGAGLLVLVR